MLDLLRLSITLNFHFPLNLIKMYIKIIIYLSFIYSNLCNLEFRLYIKKIHYILFIFTCIVIIILGGTILFFIQRLTC